MKFEFVDRKDKYNAKIKVIGVGGGGGNAINNMIAADLKGVEFISANTDSQNLERSACSNRLQLGPNVTRGLGSGGDPEIGKLAAEESLNDIRDVHSRHGRRHRYRGCSGVRQDMQGERRTDCRRSHQAFPV